VIDRKYANPIIAKLYLNPTLNSQGRFPKGVGMVKFVSILKFNTARISDNSIKIIIGYNSNSTNKNKINGVA
jgi:hypothetical protein